MKKTLPPEPRVSPRILLIDIETSPSLGYFFDLWKEGNIIETVQEWYILSVGVKWLDEKRVSVFALPDFPLYLKDKHNDLNLMQKIHAFISQADILVAHNGDQFDIKKINARLIAHNLTPPPPNKTVDTLKAARRHFKFNSNKLDELGRYFKIGRKLAHTGKHLWLACIRGDPKAWKKMRAYNKQDVILLEKVYLKLRPWIANHPNLNLYKKTTQFIHDACPVCQSAHVWKRGFVITGTTRLVRRQRYECAKCHRWFQGVLLDKKKV